jgi:dTDP-4-dehydrorhamnose 3,5-epimerase
MKAKALSLSGVVEITTVRHVDERGYFAETFRDRWFQDEVAPLTFVQENQSLSRQPGTVRGLHYQTAPTAQGKLVRCLAGAIFDVAVDIRRGSSTYGQWLGVTLTPEAGNQLWVPPGFLHGFCTLLPDTLVSYKVTQYYSPEHDAGIAWDDPEIGVAWPEIADPRLLSDKDSRLPRLRELSADANAEMEHE